MGNCEVPGGGGLLLGFVLGVSYPRLVSCEVTWRVLIPVQLTILPGCGGGLDSLPAADEPAGDEGGSREVLISAG